MSDICQLSINQSNRTNLYVNQLNAQGVVVKSDANTMLYELPITAPTANVVNQLANDVDGHFSWVQGINDTTNPVFFGTSQLFSMPQGTVIVGGAGNVNQFINRNVSYSNGVFSNLAVGYYQASIIMSVYNDGATNNFGVVLLLNGVAIGDETLIFSGSTRSNISYSMIVAISQGDNISFRVQNYAAGNSLITSTQISVNRISLF